MRHKGHFPGQRRGSVMAGCISEEGAAARQRGPTTGHQDGRKKQVQQEAGWREPVLGL